MGNKFDEVNNAIDDVNSNLTKSLKELEEISRKLRIAMLLTKTNVRIKKMKEEILLLGWDKIVEKYHPDVNIHDKAANQLFEMYKYVNENLDKVEG